MSKGNWVEFNDPTPTNHTEANASSKAKTNQQVRVQRIRNNKGGKTITEISGLGLNQKELLKLLKKLKTLLGTGGTLKGELLEIQGEQVKKVMELLVLEGFHPKQSGS